MTSPTSRRVRVGCAVILSLQTRQVLGYSLADRMPDDLVLHAFHNAWQRSLGPRGILFHSDRGSQYASHRFRRTLELLGFVPSMSRRANCWDNAVAESFFATLKNEEATATYPSKATAHAGIANHTHRFYNPTRRHSTLGNMSPDNYARTIATDPSTRFLAFVWEGYALLCPPQPMRGRQSTAPPRREKIPRQM